MILNFWTFISNYLLFSCSEIAYRSSLHVWMPLLYVEPIVSILRYEGMRHINMRAVITRYDTRLARSGRSPHVCNYRSDAHINGKFCNTPWSVQLRRLVSVTTSRFVLLILTKDVILKPKNSTIVGIDHRANKHIIALIPNLWSPRWTKHKGL